MADISGSSLLASPSTSATAGPAAHRQSGNTPTKSFLDKEEFLVRKRLPPHLPKRNIDVYITNKTAFKAQLDRCKKLIDHGNKELYVHSLGAAIPRALNLALCLQKAYGAAITLETATSTVELTDDFEPAHGEGVEQSRSRNNSSIHIKISYNPQVKDLEIAEIATTVTAQQL